MHKCRVCGKDCSHPHLLKQMDDGICFGCRYSGYDERKNRRVRTAVVEGSMKGNQMELLQNLKTFNADRADMDELIALNALAKSMAESYGMFGVESPDWFDANTKALAREIKTRNAANLERMLKEAELKLEALKTPTERRDATLAQIEALKAKLATA